MRSSSARKGSTSDMCPPASGTCARATPTSHNGPRPSTCRLLDVSTGNGGWGRRDLYVNGPPPLSRPEEPGQVHDGGTAGVLWLPRAYAAGAGALGCRCG
jgi:hypothetical protein